jgi:predicted DCC family thiol-disulfide oxidoreductase YuxK
MDRPAAPRYRVTSPPPERPLFVYDGSCGFCRSWIGRSRRLTEGAVVYAASQEIAPLQVGIPAEAFERSAILIMPDGEAFSGAEAVLRALALVPARRLPLVIYQRAPGAAPLAEAVYRLVARHRPFLTRLTERLSGRAAGPGEGAPACGSPGGADRPPGDA